MAPVDGESRSTEKVEETDAVTDDIASETIDPEEVLASLSDIRFERHNGRTVPYQLLVLLWAISRARSGAQRLPRYCDVRSALSQILWPFKVSDSPPNPANPWFALHNSDWWELSPPLPTDYNDVSSLNTQAGLRKPIYDLIATDAQWTERAVEKIISLVGNSNQLRNLIVTLNLADLPTTAPGSDALYRRILVNKHTNKGALVSGGRATKRRQLADMWAKYYPQPLAELIAVITQPFDDDDTTLAKATVEAHKAARRRVRELFPQGQARPSGGEIEAALYGIARRLLEALETDEAASLSAERLASAIRLLDGVIPAHSGPPMEDLVVPETVRRLDGHVPFAMWR